MDRNTSDIVTAQLAFTGVEPGSDTEVNSIGRIDDRPGASNPSRWTVEAGEHAVAGGFHHDPAVPVDLDPDGSIVRVEQFAPAPVTKFGGAARGIRRYR